MDNPQDALVTTSHTAGAMNYPSTTQALFALIVMMIVLVFILVYCCWGTFSCAHQDDNSGPEEARTRVVAMQQPEPHFLQGSHAVIVPINNMIYVGDPESNRIYQIPLDHDKPPAYTEVYSGIPPPPYATDTSTPDPELSRSPANFPETRRTLPDSPPSYEDCLTLPPDNNVKNLIPEQQTNIPSKKVPRNPQSSPPTSNATDESRAVASSATPTEFPRGRVSQRAETGIMFVPGGLMTSDDHHPPPSNVMLN